MALVSTISVDGIIKSDIPTSYVVSAAVGFAVILIAIRLVLATMLLEIGVNGVELGINVLGRISNGSSKLIIRQQLMSIWCQNRFLYSLQ